ncbi:histidine phosphatase family protein [Jeotgalibaca sp. MA1X17-3]|uniref:histidine phosphatase family protein n=1 Tax=Jeotgalibaca sp. MA1X17-3 TaxID=2908211 RepID=UPI001F27C5B2|nr:histidine phosphatase family protein [Jeotgalibaca sp. MA1X17-3]UJF15639.1 histidine phosphatase family protein [Jeotgalibaca sp. MA1X17-3]
MQQLYFVRHGQTELNAANRVQGGDIDSPLLEQSRKDAIKTGLALKDASVSKVVASPQLRAKETAQIIVSQLDSRLSLEEDVLLKEFGYGEWEGKDISELHEKYPTLLHQLRKEPHLYDPSSFGGETYPDLILRGTQSILYHVKNNPEKNILFVGHSITLTATILSLVGFPLEEIRSQTPMENTSITRLIYNQNEFKLDQWNYIEHLK